MHGKSKLQSFLMISKLKRTFLVRCHVNWIQINLIESFSKLLKAFENSNSKGYFTIPQTLLPLPMWIMHQYLIQENETSQKISLASCIKQHRHVSQRILMQIVLLNQRSDKNLECIFQTSTIKLCHRIQKSFEKIHNTLHR